MNITKYTNRVVLFCNLWFCAVIGYLMANRSMFQSLSEDIYPDSDNLMGSAFADIFVRKELIVLVLIIVILTLFKERRLKERYLTRLWSNGLISLILMSFGGYLLSKLYPF